MFNYRITFVWILIGVVYAEYDEYTIRLNGENGRLEMFYDGKWRNVCDSFWQKSNSEVACRQLGFARPDEWRGSYPATSSTVIPFRYICSGYESKLETCIRINQTYCKPTRVVALKCTNEDKYQSLYQGLINLVGASDPLDMKNEGIIITYFYGRWGRVCTENWSDENSKIVCKQLGFDTDSVSLVPANRYDVKTVDHLPFHNFTIVCVGDERNLTDCTFSIKWCSTNSKSVAVTCTSESNTGSAGKVVAIFVGFCFLLLFFVTASYMWKRHQKEKNANRANSFPVTHFLAQNNGNEYVQVEHSGTTHHTEENE